MYTVRLSRFTLHHVTPREGGGSIARVRAIISRSGDAFTHTYRNLAATHILREERKPLRKRAKFPWRVTPLSRPELGGRVCVCVCGAPLERVCSGELSVAGDLLCESGCCGRFRFVYARPLARGINLMARRWRVQDREINDGARGGLWGSGI